METIHPTAQRLQQRLHERGLDVEVRVLPDSTRTAAEAAAACGCELGAIVKSLVFVVDGEPTMVLCAGDRRVDTASIGGVPPLGHERELPTVVDASLRRFERVWCAAGTPHAVFEVGLDALLAALPDAAVRDVGDGG
jgi:prolyl-tRNA editing enzyme YbaK/EbsC (Cys-tRNA(Pro) deacylase)